MQRTKLTYCLTALLICLVAIVALVSTPPAVEGNSRHDLHELISLDEVSLQMGFILRDFRRIEQGTPICVQQACGSVEGSWRPTLAIKTHAVLAEGEELMDILSPLYTLANAELAKHRRFARIQAYVGPASILREIAANQAVPKLVEIDSEHPLADAIVLLEVGDTKLLWDEPGDISTPFQDFSGEDIGRLGIVAGKFHVGFADGAVWRLTADVPVRDFAIFLTTSGAQENDREALLSDYVLDRLDRSPGWDGFD